MKFYYDGKLIRTSKNHNYTHAVINMETGKCIGCRSNLQGAMQLANERIGEIHTSIDNYFAAIKALKEGKTMYQWREGNRKGWARFGEKVLADREAAITRREAEIERLRGRERWYRENWIVVELEARA